MDGQAGWLGFFALQALQPTHLLDFRLHGWFENMPTVLAGNGGRYNPVDGNGELLHFVYDLRNRKLVWGRRPKDRQTWIIQDRCLDKLNLGLPQVCGQVDPVRGSFLHSIVLARVVLPGCGVIVEDDQRFRLLAAKRAFRQIGRSHYHSPALRVVGLEEVQLGSGQCCPSRHRTALCPRGSSRI